LEVPVSKRHRIIVAILLGLLLGALFVGQASAVTVAGGTPEQHAIVQSVVEQCSLDYRVVDEWFDGISIRFLNLNGPSGLAHSTGWIELHSGLNGELLAAVMAHEWSHQIYRMMGVWWHSAWEKQCTGFDYRAWNTNPSEHFAEMGRLALFGLPQYLPVQTTLPFIDAASFVADWKLAYECPCRRDLTGEDVELQTAVGYLAAHGIIQGYADGTYRPSQPLLRRHVGLICERAGLSSGLDGYLPATRGDVRDSMPGLTWLEERWGEPITRGQLARLVYRLGGLTCE